MTRILSNISYISKHDIHREMIETEVIITEDYN
jgi:hypothetical protein